MEFRSLPVRTIPGATLAKNRTRIVLVQWLFGLQIPPSGYQAYLIIAAVLADAGTFVSFISLAIHALCLTVASCRQVNSQRRHIAPHCPSQSHQRCERQIVFAALDPANVAPIHSSRVRQPLLRHPKLAPASANAFAKDVEIRIAHPRSERAW